MHRFGRRRVGGFSMIEVLVALLVLAIGLLGVAGLQGLALKSVGDAERRATAQNLAGSLVEIARTSSAALSTYDIDKIDDCPAAGDFAAWCTQVKRELNGANAVITVNGGVLNIALSWAERLNGSKYEGAADEAAAATGRVTFTFEARLR